MESRAVSPLWFRIPLSLANKSIKQHRNNSSVLQIPAASTLLAMSQSTKPESMSLSEWRLWCCCHPPVTPSPSSPRQRDDISLEEFDPRNRLSMSRAYGQSTHAAPPPPPSTPTEMHDSTPPIRRSTSKQSARHSDAKPQPENKAGQRPSTVLLPSLPQQPPRSQEAKVAKAEQSKPNFVRQDSEPGEKWWQVGKRIWERKGDDRK